MNGLSQPSLRSLPGDDVLPEARLVMDRVLDLAGSPAQAWPRLEQLGKRRAGWYMPRRIEAFIPRSRRATRRIEQRWVGLSVGDEIPGLGSREPAVRDA